MCLEGGVANVSYYVFVVEMEGAGGGEEEQETRRCAAEKRHGEPAINRQPGLRRGTRRADANIGKLCTSQRITVATLKQPS